MIYQPLLIRDSQYFIDIGPMRNYPAHMHSEVELVYCLDGELPLMLAGEKHVLKPHDLVFVEKLVPHEYINAEGTRLAIQVGSLFLGEHYKKFSNITFENPVISLADLPEEAENLRMLRKILDEIAEEYLRTGKRYTSLNIRGNIYKICHLIMEEYFDAAAKPWHVADDIHTVLELVHNHYDEPLDVETVAQMINYGKSSFCFHFKKLTGQTFHTYLNSFRIKKAIHLLNETASSIESIAYMVGFNDPKTFSRVFKTIVGISPRDYRNQGKHNEKTQAQAPATDGTGEKR